MKEEIDCLNSRIMELAESCSQRMNRGVLLYNSVKAGNTMVEWDKDDYDMFIEYFDAIDHATVKRHRKEYRDLTSRALASLLLQDLGMSDDDIRKMMVLSQNGLRSMKYRIAQKKR